MFVLSSCYLPLFISSSWCLPMFVLSSCYLPLFISSCLPMFVLSSYYLPLFISSSCYLPCLFLLIVCPCLFYLLVVSSACYLPMFISSSCYLPVFISSFCLHSAELEYLRKGLPSPDKRPQLFSELYISLCMCKSTSEQSTQKVHHKTPSTAPFSFSSP